MGFELRHLRYLLAVAEHGSFTRAAESLHISQPTLSQQIRQMERVVGAQLLDRTGRAVRLTDAGEAYLHYARRALQELAAAERAVHDVADLSRGSLRLAVTPTFTTYLIGPLAGQLHACHPHISLSIREMTQDRIESALLADDLDLGIAFHGSHLPGITAENLFTETLGLVVGTHHPDTDRTAPLPVRELEGRPLALLSSDFVTRRHIDAYFDRHRTTPHIAVEANSIHAVTEIVRRTPLASVLPAAIARDHSHLRPVPLDPPLPERTVALLRRSDAYQSAAARAFVRLTRQWVASSGYPASP
ncbi:transcriptional regulator CynR [Streptomyces sp. NPDC021212]|uniref:transcriptional regulator CynR n=1 Tax=Streptomyces sp. NPDC021212 TaxID=3365118 RepID=UPI00378A4295